MIKYAVKVVEVKNGSKTFDRKEQLKAEGFRWMSALSVGYSQAWVKEVQDVEEACKVIKELDEMGFGADFGAIIKNTFFSISDAIERQPEAEAEMREAKKAVYIFRKENNLF